MKVLITGAFGQVGRELTRRVPDGVHIKALGREALDVGDADAVREHIATIRPDVIINTAAFTAVDRAEREPELARRVNGLGPRNLAESARLSGSCRLIQLSTDYVFDGESEIPYSPTAVTHPLNVYGSTKLEGERAVRDALGTRGLILRTSWVYASHGHNFVLTMLRRMREGKALRVVSDQIGAPTAACSVAEAVWAVAFRADLYGTFHWTDAGAVSWYEFAVAIADEGVALGLLRGSVELQPITSDLYPTPARRPRRSVLECQTSQAALQMAPLPWRERLRQVLEECRLG